MERGAEGAVMVCRAGRAGDGEATDRLSDAGCVALALDMDLAFLPVLEEEEEDEEEGVLILDLVDGETEEGGESEVGLLFVAKFPLLFSMFTSSFFNSSSKS
jgi:hypothetical protein